MTNLYICLVSLPGLDNPIPFNILSRHGDLRQYFRPGRRILCQKDQNSTIVGKIVTPPVLIAAPTNGNEDLGSPASFCKALGGKWPLDSIIRPYGTDLLFNGVALWPFEEGKLHEAEKRELACHFLR